MNGMNSFDRLHWTKEIELRGYFLPQTLGECLEYLSAHNGRARIIAGGTDMIPQLRRREFQADYLVDLSRIPGLGFIRLENDQIIMGPLVTHARICASGLLREKAPALVEGAAALGSPQIRNISTVGGNLVSGEPAADTSLPLVALDGAVKILSSNGEREVPLSEFFLGPGRTVVDSRREILTEIRFRALGENQGSCYLRLSKRKGLSLPILALAVTAAVDPARNIFREVRLAVGPVAPVPFRAARAEGALHSAPIGAEGIEEAAEIAAEEANPRSSALRGSAEYRKEMVKVLVRRGLLRALERAGFPLVAGGQP
jgi:aerobic carbon-monoxide dehydrogenase medium subunit